jgi:type IV secretion system protein VirB3
MEENGSVTLDPLFVGLTRPTLFFGVSQMFGMLNGFVCVVGFIQTSDFRAAFIGVILHLVGYIACFKEPLIIELVLMKSQKFSKCKNKMFHRANSYDFY